LLKYNKPSNRVNRLFRRFSPFSGKRASLVRLARPLRLLRRVRRACRLPQPDLSRPSRRVRRPRLSVPLDLLRRTLFRLSDSNYCNSKGYSCTCCMRFRNSYNIPYKIT
jgi:hypothetical protein